MQKNDSFLCTKVSCASERASWEPHLLMFELPLLLFATLLLLMLVLPPLPLFTTLLLQKTMRNVSDYSPRCCCKT